MFMRPGYGSEPLFYDRQGNPMESSVEWAKLGSDPEYRFVKKDFLDQHIVLTVWLGLDHAAGAYDRPHIFTTGVFSKKEGLSVLGPMLEEYSWATEEEALAGHDGIVTTIRATSPATE